MFTEHQATGRARPLSRFPAYGAGATLYELDPPLQGHSHVLVTSGSLPLGGWETWVLPAAPNGRPLDATRLPGSGPGPTSHEEVLAAAGYRIA